jgi:TolB-like protein/class 3 adenylate cyclase/Tfp pilus assembly protein PilF
MERRLTTIVSMDVVGYSRLMERNETGTLSLLKEVRATIIDPSIVNHGGRTIKLMGDGALSEFSSVVSALKCAVEIQNGLVSRNHSASGKDNLHFRIGLHLGDVIIDGDDVYGDGVNVAARLESMAEPDGIVISKQVHDHIGSNLPVQFVSLGEQFVKNISRPIHAYRVDFASETTSSNTIRFHDFELDTALFELRKSGERIPVEPQVFDLLTLLAQNHNRIVTKEEIFAEIWVGRTVSDAALSSQIKSARRVLGDDGTAQNMISTVHGRGFRFVAQIIDSKEPSATAVEHASDDSDFRAIDKRPSAAILPFVNLNRDPDEDYFADGITEDITTALAKNRWLTVVARNPAFSFRNSKESIRQIGQKLNANYVVTGTVRKAGTRFRITVEIIDAENELSVWSERFDKNKVDIFDLQDEISELVASRIESELGLTEQRKAERRPRKNLGAWDLYQLGTAEFYKFTAESNLKCQELTRRSIELDPEFSGAHCRLAYAMVLSMVYFDAKPDNDVLDEALAIAKRAIQLDDQDANSYFTIGRVYLARCEYDLAMDALHCALELNPCLAVTYCGLGDSLAYEGRLDDAIEQFEIAIKLSPHDPFRWAFYSYRSMAHLFLGQYEEAASWARKAVQMPNAQYWAKAHLVSALGHLDDQAKTDAALAVLLETKPNFSIKFAAQQLFYIKRADQLEIYLEGLRKAGLN